jgi:glycosyltransferase involved in cell wall biosynthesis
MKIAIVNNQAPFVRGGAEYLADSLARKLEQRGHRVDVVRIPFKWYPLQAIPEHMLACRLFNVAAGEPDRVIALKFPAYLAPCDNKYVWLLHQFRQMYELWGTPWGDLPDTPESRRVRSMVHAADTACLGQAHKLFTNSRTVAGRLKTFNGIQADEVLYPPLENPELFGPGPAGDYFFYPSRQNTGKRQHVAVEAMRHVRSPFRLVLAGKADRDSYGEELRKQVERWGLQDRVQFIGWISEEEKARWMSGCLGALYLPYDEDSYGYVTLEAFHCHKPVITFTDSGGTMEVMEHQQNGLIVEPTPEALAEAMESLWNNRTRSEQLGEEAHATLARYRIDWDHVLDTLTAA